MSYFLLNKFRGAFFGSLAVKKLVNNNQDFKADFDNKELLNQQQWLLFLEREVTSVMPNQEKLLNIWWKTIFNDLSLVPIKDSVGVISCSAFSLSILPVILYYHDYWHYLSEFIIQKGKKLQKSPTEIDNVLVWCYVVRLALRGELVSYNLTKRVVEGTKIQQESVIVWLEKLELFFLESFGLEDLLEYLFSIKSKEIPLSLFCFFNNPQDFYLTTKQALFLAKDFVGAGALSGVISGAYNGMTGIPINWRSFCQHQNFYSAVTIQIEEMTNEWLGIDGETNLTNTSSVITAPQIMQPRPSMQVISQQEYGSSLMY